MLGIHVNQDMESLMGRLLPLNTPETRDEVLLVESLRSIIASGHVNILLQPIVALHDLAVYGYESLSRGPSDSPLHNPLQLFDIARRAGRLTETDLLCRRCGIRSFVSHQLDGLLFLNATPQSLLESGHPSGLTMEALAESGLDPTRVVIELTEQHPSTDMEAMGKAIEHYRGMGFRIAIDDLGAGYSSLQRWSQLRPEYVKIDRHFIQDIDRDRTKQAFVNSILTLANGLKCHLIAEGIETEAEYATLRQIGIRYGQGYLFARPAENPTRCVDTSITGIRSPGEHATGVDVAEESTIRDVLLEAPALTLNHSLEHAYQIFMRDDALSAVAIVDVDNHPLGLLRRSRLLTTFSSQYGRSLHGHKSAQTLMDDNAVAVEVDWDLERISALVTRNMQSRIEAEFLICHRDQYLGLGKVIDLLRKVTETQIRNARHANPLSGLPGNVPIYKRLDEASRRREPISVAYFDLDHFKPFNDVYGYARGDAVIRLVARILQQSTCMDDDFLGHVGGDDFIVVFRSRDWMDRCQHILTAFDAAIGNQYREEDRHRGGIFALSREGDSRFFPIMSLSIGAICPDMTDIVSHDDISDMAAKAKHNAKNLPGSSLYVERRARPMQRPPVRL